MMVESDNPMIFFGNDIIIKPAHAAKSALIEMIKYFHQFWNIAFKKQEFFSEMPVTALINQKINHTLFLDDLRKMAEPGGMVNRITADKVFHAFRALTVRICPVQAVFPCFGFICKFFCNRLINAFPLVVSDFMKSGLVDGTLFN